MATMEPATPEPLSDPLRRVLEALVDGTPAPPDALAALTDGERAEMAALLRTSHFVRLTFQAAPGPTAEAEATALARAREALAQRGFPVAPAGAGAGAAGVTDPEADAPPRPAVLAWLERLRRRNR